MKHVVIYKERDAYVSFPHAAILPSGELAVTFRKASKFSADAARKGVHTHHDPDSSIEMIVSPDRGESWPQANRRTVYKSNYGVNDPALTILRDGSILNRFVALDIRSTAEVTRPSQKLFSHRVEHGLVTTVVGNMIVRSTDGGRNWNLLSVANTEETGPSCSRDPIIEMPDGSLLMPVYTGAPQRSDIAWVIRSFDGGKCWCEPTRVMSDEAGRFSQLQGINYNEMSLLHLGNGHMLAMVRADHTFHTTGDEFMPVGGVGNLYTAESFDGGLSWTLPRPTGIFGQPGSIIRIDEKRILSTYGYRKAPYGTRCCISNDGGLTWDHANEIIIRDDSPTWDCGYPFTISLGDGKMFTVYYIVDEEATRYVAGTHWTLEC